MRQYDFISAKEIHRLAFKAYLNKVKLNASGLRLLGRQRYFQEAARYLINIHTAMHRIPRDSVKSGLRHVEGRVMDENEATGFREGVIEARSLMVDLL